MHLNPDPFSVPCTLMRWLLWVTLPVSTGSEVRSPERRAPVNTHSSVQVKDHVSSMLTTLQQRPQFKLLTWSPQIPSDEAPPTSLISPPTPPSSILSSSALAFFSLQSYTSLMSTLGTLPLLSLLPRMLFLWVFTWLAPSGVDI